MKNFEELQDKFLALTDDEKDFVAWCSIDRLVEQYENEAKKKNQDIYYQWYLTDAISALKKASEALAYKIF